MVCAGATAAVIIIEPECGGCDIGTDRERSVHHDGTHGHPWVKVFDPRCRLALDSSYSRTFPARCGCSRAATVRASLDNLVNKGEEWTSENSPSMHSGACGFERARVRPLSFRRVLRGARFTTLQQR